MSDERLGRFARDFGYCFLCFGATEHFDWLEIQHISRRGQSDKELVHSRSNLLRAHRSCHAGPLATMPHAEQLAYKFFCDSREWYTVEDMLKEWLPIGGPCTREAPNRVTVGDVMATLGKLIAIGAGRKGDELAAIRQRVRDWRQFQRTAIQFCNLHSGLWARQDTLGTWLKVVRYIEIEAGRYRVGDDGSVWSRKGRCGLNDEAWRYRKWRRLVPIQNTRATMHVAIRIRRKRRFIHRLVLEAFVGPCPVGGECMHKDDNPRNNSLRNLKWGTLRESAAGVGKGPACISAVSVSNMPPIFRPEYIALASLRGEW